jgi:dTDP-4-amino-4,6-dideoxygalactose transaminase
MTNCTAALHLALVILDISAGDEVIVPSFTFVATANAVTSRRYPVIARITSLEDLTISPEDIEKKITDKTKR